MPPQKRPVQEAQADELPASRSWSAALYGKAGRTLAALRPFRYLQAKLRSRGAGVEPSLDGSRASSLAGSLAAEEAGTAAGSAGEPQGCRGACSAQLRCQPCSGVGARGDTNERACAGAGELLAPSDDCQGAGEEGSCSDHDSSPAGLAQASSGMEELETSQATADFEPADFEREWSQLTRQ